MFSYASLIGRLAAALGQAPASRPLPWRLCHAAQGVLGADGASLTLENTTPGRVTLCATDRRAELLEDLQDVLGEGPTPHAFLAGRRATAPLREAEAAVWPEFTIAAKKIIGPAGVIWSLPMRPAGETLGTISLYRLARGHLAEPPDAAQFLVNAVGAMLLTDPHAFVEAAGDGWASRAVVHQATGMLVAQLGVHADGALAILRSYAFRTSTELNRVARDVVDRRLDLSHA